MGPITPIYISGLWSPGIRSPRSCKVRSSTGRRLSRLHNSYQPPPCDLPDLDLRPGSIGVPTSLIRSDYTYILLCNQNFRRYQPASSIRRNTFQGTSPGFWYVLTGKLWLVDDSKLRYSLCIPYRKNRLMSSISEAISSDTFHEHFDSH
jgi:hypothetical protein